MAPSLSSARGNAHDSRAAILQAAIEEFGRRGYHGGTTERIARAVGKTQPYIFKLYGSKKDLFIAAIQYVYDHIQTTFEQAARDDTPDKLHALGLAYVPLLRTRHEILLMLHAFTAADDEDVALVVRDRYAKLLTWVRDTTGAPEDAVRAFFAEGTSLMVAASIKLPDLIDPAIRPALFGDTPPTP
ncbi:TetR/AcrR family transcriptional regulator [Deinococcus pimensis]|uniref:TetR/AcrR family transcriptional regulator n=1 Tax=Deinococcus pimensis TaxID=309888 RepID=UPI0004BBBAF1|nr:TetR/AcrR family transcriptional regulator [Deinococcus pimensis]